MIFLSIVCKVFPIADAILGFELYQSGALSTIIAEGEGWYLVRLSSVEEYQAALERYIDALEDTSEIKLFLKEHLTQFIQTFQTKGGSAVMQEIQATITRFKKIEPQPTSVERAAE
jgi:hypothetical protein